MKQRNTIKPGHPDKLSLQLFVSGMSSKSMDAIQNIKHICKKYMKEDFDLEIIDIYKHPEVASQHHIVFSPSLIKIAPLPKKILVGNLSDEQKVVRSLGLTDL